MRKAQGPVGVVVGLLALVIILFVIVFAFRPATTGQVVSLDDEEPEVGVETLDVNSVSLPFELRAWVVASDGIRVDVKNLGEEDYWVKTLAITGCGAHEQNKVIMPGNSEILVVECSLNQGAEFEGEISLVYRKIGGGPEQVSKGVLKDIV